MGFKQFFTEATNKDIVTRFFDTQNLKDGKGVGNLLYSKNLDGWSLINYSTPILYKDRFDKEYVINKDKYSSTTSTIQNMIRNIAKERGIKLKELSTEKLEDFIIGLSGMAGHKQFTNADFLETQGMTSGDLSDDDESEDVFRTE